MQMQPQQSQILVMRVSEELSSARWIVFVNEDNTTHAAIDLSTLMGIKTRKAKAQSASSNLADIEPVEFDVWEVVLVQMHDKVCSVIIKDEDYPKLLQRVLGESPHGVTPPEAA